MKRRRRLARMVSRPRDMLTTRQVVEYLLEHKLLDPALLVAGELKVIDASRRNLVFKVICAQGPSYLVKQGNTPDTIATVEHEATVYRLLHSEHNIGASSLSEYIPLFYAYDRNEYLLILELQRDAEDIREYHVHKHRFSKTLGASMGTVLATLHSSPGLRTEDYRLSSFPQHVPWALAIHRPPVAIFKEVSAANLQLIKIVQGCPEFCACLDGLRHDWRADRLIHRDIKLENWIVVSEASMPQRVTLKLVDWELAARGDPCWDVGSLFSGYLSFWLSSVPITGREPPERFLQLPNCPLERIQPVLCSFWESYCNSMSLDTIANEWLLRATKYAAVRLIQTAFEQSRRMRELTGNLVGLLQLSLNILRRPREAAALLLQCTLPHCC